MSTPSLATVECQRDGSARDELSARYVYCVVKESDPVSLGPIGIEGREVRVAAHQGLGALVHGGPPRPYQTKDKPTAAEWILAHHRVVETAWHRWGTVLPLTFNTIVSSNDASADNNLLSWLAAECDSLTSKLRALAGKAEYGLQVSCDPSRFVSQALATVPELCKLEEEARSQSRGLAYLCRQKLDAMLKKEVEALALRECAQLYAKLKACVAETRFEKARTVEQGELSLLHISCLVSEEQLDALKVELKRVQETPGLSVRLAGPFPPYSFC